MSGVLLERLIRVAARVPLVRASAERIGIRDRLHRWRTVSSLSGPAVDTGAAYDPERMLLSLEGSWQTIGRQLARATDLRSSVDVARRFSEALPVHERTEYRKMVADAFDHARAKRSDIGGLIDGAASELREFSVVDVACAALWPTIVPWAAYSASCSGIVVRGVDGLIAGQNLDLGPTNNVVLVKLVPDDSPARLCHLIPGSFWFGTGVNEYGLTMVGGSVNVDRPFESRTMSITSGFCHLIAHGERSTGGACEALAAGGPYGPTHDGSSFLVADGSGQIDRIEMTGSDLVVRHEDGPFAVAVNHFIHEDLVSLNRVSDEPSRLAYENSVGRQSCAAAAFEGAGRITAGDVREFLRRRRGPGNWNRNASPPDTGWTTASYVIDLGRNVFHYRLGTRPRDKAWKELALEGLFRGR